jgi:RNA polymerase sigma factor (sigma-70 family)
VLQAVQSPGDEMPPALEELCRTYWYPLYFYIRRRGNDAHQAQDLTQAFFARLLENNSLSVADPERGRFRTFLLCALNNFLHNEHNHASRKKRGGGLELLPLEEGVGEDRFLNEPACHETPERIFERRWVETLLQRVITRLRQENVDAGEGERFELLKVYLVEDRGAVAFAEMAPRLGLTEAAVKGVVRRLRSRYREILRDEVAQTVADPADVESEIRHLLTVLS